MPLNFKAQIGGAIDLDTGLTICEPRTLPASLPTNPDRVEYQYTLYRGDERYYIGLFGVDTVVEKDGHKEWIFALDFGRDWVLDSVFSIKRDLGNDDDDFVFLQGLARGLVAMFEKDHSEDDVRYVVLTDTALLAARGITVPNGVTRLGSGEIVLAEILTPAQTSAVLL